MAVVFKGTESADLGEMVPTVRRLDGTRIEFTADDYKAEAFRTFSAIESISSE